MSPSTPQSASGAPDGAPVTTGGGAGNGPDIRPGQARSGAPSEHRPYHHGDLKATLVRTGYELAREQGVDAVTLRGLTRLVGVTPSSAYRHFTNGDDLKLAISLCAMGDLARAIEAEQTGVRAGSMPDAERARERLAAVGRGYIGFALDEPRAFEVAMFSLLTLDHAADPEGAGDTGRTPHQLLTDALAELATSGQLDADRVPAASVLCWSGVHGFATLATQGPMRTLPRAALDQLATDLVTALVEATLRH